MSVERFERELIIAEWPLYLGRRATGLFLGRYSRLLKDRRSRKARRWS